MQKILQLRQGRSPLSEPGVATLIDDFAMDLQNELAPDGRAQK
jgi:hypothetical protein